MYISFIFSCLIQLSIANQFRLLWAPINLKNHRPFLSIFNDLQNPYWKTRNVITKERIYMGDLKLPVNFSFSIICGGCVDARPYYIIKGFGLSVVITNNNFTVIPILSNKKKSSFHYIQNVICLMSFIYVRKIQSEGEIRCTLRYGKRVLNESVPFDIQRKIESNLVNQSSLLIPKDKYISCPEFDNSKYLTTTWSLDDGKSVIPVTQSKILLKKYYDQIKNNITCIRYDLTKGTRVKQITYRRIDSTDDENNRNGYLRGPTIIIISVVMMFLIVCIILLCIIYLVNRLK